MTLAAGRHHITNFDAESARDAAPEGHQARVSLIQGFLAIRESGTSLLGLLCDLLPCFRAFLFAGFAAAHGGDPFAGIHSAAAF